MHASGSDMAYACLPACLQGDESNPGLVRARPGLAAGCRLDLPRTACEGTQSRHTNTALRNPGRTAAAYQLQRSSALRLTLGGVGQKEPSLFTSSFREARTEAEIASFAVRCEGNATIEANSRQQALAARAAVRILSSLRDLMYHCSGTCASHREVRRRASALTRL